MTDLPLITIIGPTASGKTALAVALAVRLDAEIISGDSRQVYRGMDIGTVCPFSSSLARMRWPMCSLCIA